ncbi:MAG: hypothetical protein MUF22_08785 [Chitinispirillaceae bacterium]|jgi:hypothetical protein|nr:hypothetical protein [Chitinispirillaceae bacterium]
MTKRFFWCRAGFFALLYCVAVSASQDTAAANVKRIVFQEQKIEGKIRRPQLVLIKADERPQFGSMSMQSIGKSANVVLLVDPDVIEKTPYGRAFRFEKTKIIDIVP